MIKLKRVYEPAEPGDGVRILVDRIWPRGLSKDAVKIEKWMKELGPSDALRKSFGHDPAKWPEFRKRYRRELESANHRAMLEELSALAAKGTLTLAYGARDKEHNRAVVIKEVLESMCERSHRARSRHASNR